jgi:hypothetical protein
MQLHKKNNLVVPEKKEKKVEYIHEVVYDKTSNQQWTIFNKHALEVHECEEETQEIKFMEDSIIEQMKLDELNARSHYCNIPQTTWEMLYEAKCQDLGIPCKMDKQMERFVTQNRLNQRDDRMSFKDQGMSIQSANIIGKYLLTGNEELLKIDLSGN